MPKVRHPKSFAITALFFVGLCLVTIFIAIQQQKLRIDKDRQGLVEVGSHLKDEFTHIVYANITAAQTLKILVEKDPAYRTHFNEFAKAITTHTPHIDAIQLTLNGQITCVYPNKKYAPTVGINTLRDSIRMAEAKHAFIKGIYVAGPRPLREGGFGILTKVPLQLSNDSSSLCVVLTRLSSIESTLKKCEFFQSKLYTIWLTKLQTQYDSSLYFLGKNRPANYGLYSTGIKEGDWTFNVAYSTFYQPPGLPQFTLWMGFICALLFSIVLYRYITQPERLEQIIKEKISQLSQQESFYQTLIHNINDAIVLLDVNGQVIYQSPSTQKISGYYEHEIKQIEPISLIHPDDLENDQEAFSTLIQKPFGTLHRKHRLKHKSGHYIWIQANYINLLNDPQIKAILLTYRNITDKVLSKASEERLTLELKERIKELSTIYHVNLVLQKNELGIDKKLTEVVNHIPNGWQFAESCSAKLHIGELTYYSNQYTPSEYILKYAFELSNATKCTIQINYHKDLPFLPEEADLLQALGDTIKNFLDYQLKKNALIASEQEFRLGFEMAPIGVLQADTNGNFTKVNATFCTMLGYDEPELIGLNFASITHEEDLEKDYSYINRALTQNDTFYQTHKRFIHKSGKEIWANVHANLIKPQNAAPYFIAMVEDLSEKQEAELMFKNLVNHTIVGVYIIQNNRLVYVNPKFEEYSGYTQDELIHMEISDLIAPDSRDDFSKLLINRLNGKLEAINYTIKAKRKDGTFLWVEIYGSTTTYLGKSALIGTVIDITPSRTLIDRIGKSEANLRSAIDHADVSFILTDMELNTLVVSKNTATLFGPLFQATPEPESYLTQYLQPGLTEHITYLLDYVKTSLSSHTFDYATDYDASKHYYSITVSPVMRESLLIGFSIALANVTQKKLLEFERLRVMNERQLMIEDLTRKNKDLTQFSYILSHNVRAPLANIIGLTSLATDETYDRETRNDAVKRINTSVKILDHVLLDLNEILKVNHAVSEAKSTIHFEEKVLQTKLLLVDDIRQTQTTILTNFSEVSSITSIKSFVQSIFYNLISNSIKYRKKGSPPIIEIWSKKINATAFELHFKDNSIGLNMELYGDKVFGLYKRFNHDVEGKGLGLFMVKTQVEKLGGSINLSSQLGQGCHFVIKLPVNS